MRDRIADSLTAAFEFRHWRMRVARPGAQPFIRIDGIVGDFREGGPASVAR
jgi:hypothetical protein